MKHGTLVQKKRQGHIYVEENHWSERWVPCGWIYYGPVFRYRYDPVPGVKHWKNSIFPYVRHMRTTQERRAACDPDYKKYVRGRRSYINLPNSWDDYWHARKEKGWKRTKKKRQWMKKGDELHDKKDIITQC